MSEKESVSPPPSRSLRPVEIWLGLLVFGVGNFMVLFILPVPTLLGGLLYAVAVALVVAVAYLVLDRRGFAAGFGGGYILMTVASGGACTLLADPGYEGAETGIAVYVLAVLIGGIAALAYEGLTWRRRRSAGPTSEATRGDRRDERAAPPLPHGRRPLRLGEVWFGMVAFGLVNYLLLFFMILGPPGLMPPLLGILYGLTIALLAAVAYLAIGWRSFAVGVVGGFVLMTVVSGGTCTLFVDLESVENGAVVTGMVVYPLVAVISGAALAIHSLVREARRRSRKET